MTLDTNTKRRYFDDVHLSPAEMASGKQHVQFFMKNNPFGGVTKTVSTPSPIRVFVNRTFFRLKKIRIPFRKAATSL